MPSTKKDLQDRMAKARAKRKEMIAEQKRKAAIYADAVEEQKKAIEAEAVTFGAAPTPEQLEPPVPVAPKKRPTAPWRPAKVLDIPAHLKDPRFTYRFVNTKKEGNELKKLQEGWEYDHELSKKLTEHYGSIRTIRDGTPTDGVYRMREMILMRIPKELAESRNQYYADRGNRAFQNAKAILQDDVRRLDGRGGVYGNIDEGQKEFIRRE